MAHQRLRWPAAKENDERRAGAGMVAASTGGNSRKTAGSRSAMRNHENNASASALALWRHEGVAWKTWRWRKNSSFSSRGASHLASVGKNIGVSAGAGGFAAKRPLSAAASFCLRLDRVRRDIARQDVDGGDWRRWTTTWALAWKKRRHRKSNVTMNGRQTKKRR